MYVISLTSRHGHYAAIKLVVCSFVETETKDTYTITAEERLMVEICDGCMGLLQVTLTRIDGQVHELRLVMDLAGQVC